MSKKIGVHGTDEETGRKTEVAMSRSEFLEKAQSSMMLSVDGKQSIVLEKKEFSTGSLGWYGNGKITTLVDGFPLKVQYNISFVVVGSKEMQ